VVCLGDMRKRRGFFDRYQNDEKLDLIGIINCAGCPTIAAPEKILKKVKALAEYRLDALHFSYCMTALCPFLKKYQSVINKVYPELEVVLGTHVAKNKIQFQNDVKELLCPSDSDVQDMNNIITGTFKKST
jgi:predicted metal-binding protein